MKMSTITYGGVDVGDEAPPLVVENLTRTHFVRYAGASGDFNPMHHDDTIATQVGNPSVFGHGMLTAGLMARVVKDWCGPEAMRRFQVRFSKQVWPGDTLTCTATVTGKRDDSPPWACSTDASRSSRAPAAGSGVRSRCAWRAREQASSSTTWG